MLEHPMITQINRTGFPKKVEREAEGVDFYGTEYFSGEDIVEHNGEIIYKENLQQYLEEELGFTFKSA